MRTGVIISFTHENNAPTFYLTGDGPAPAAGNVILVRRPVSMTAPDNSRPGSPGVQSLQLITPTGPGMPSWRYPLDAYAQNQDHSAGKLLVAEGGWHFEIWARAATASDTLNIRFGRSPTMTFLNETIPLSTTWQHITRNFIVPINHDPLTPGVTPPALLLDLRRAQGGGPVWVDDVVLMRSGQTNPTAFSDKLVTRLQELRPGILRNWGMQQLGSTLDNQLAEPWARRLSGYAPNQSTATLWHYSIHEFLELATYIGAEPWYVIPPTFSFWG
jgi:hypothetical protein